MNETVTTILKTAGGRLLAASMQQGAVAPDEDPVILDGVGVWWRTRVLDQCAVSN